MGIEAIFERSVGPDRSFDASLREVVTDEMVAAVGSVMGVGYARSDINDKHSVHFTVAASYEVKEVKASIIEALGSPLPAALVVSEPDNGTPTWGLALLLCIGFAGGALFVSLFYGGV